MTKAGPAAQRALDYLADVLKRQKVTQRKIAETLDCSQSKAAKILKGRVHLRVDDLERLCEIAGISIVEVLRERGKEFVADLTPSEMLLLTQFRNQAEGLREHWLALMVQSGRLDQNSLKPVHGSGKRTLIKVGGTTHGHGAVSDSIDSASSAAELATALIYRLTPLATGAIKRTTLGAPKGKKS